MPVDASTARTINRLVVDTDTAFDDLRRGYESLVPTIDFAEVCVIVLGGLAGIQHSGQLHMQVNRGGVVRPLARVHE